MVAERSVTLRRYIVICIGKIRNDNVGMSNDKRCKKRRRLKFKVSKTRLIRFGICKSVSKKRTKVLFDEKKDNKFLFIFKSDKV